jgi:uncharacterized protein involved in exopolysaccharide biosynthesis
MRDPSSSARSKRFPAALRRRRYWAAAVGLAALATTFALASRTEPAYRATASLRLEGRTLPAEIDRSPELDADVSDYASLHLQTRYARVLREAEASRRAGLTVDRIVLDDASGGAPQSISIGFAVFADGADQRTAERAAQALVAAMQDDDARSAANPAVPVQELETARAEADASGEALRALELELEGFERNNAAGLPGLQERNAEATRQAERERVELEQQTGALEARRIELDRGLRDMQRGAADYRPGDGPLTSEMLAALQARWAVLRGRYGADHPDAAALGTEIAAAQAVVARRLDAATAEIRQVQDELDRLERLYPIDHPDVVRLAHRVSALESQAEPLRITGLTNGERAYIEGLARERRDIDPQLAELRERSASLQTRMAEHRAQVEQAPILEQQHGLLQQQVADAQARQQSANAQYAALLAAQETAREQRPGQLSIVAAPTARRLPMSRPGVIAALGGIAGLLALVLVVALVERIDPRITGAAVSRLQGSRPLAEIPLLA